MSTVLAVEHLFTSVQTLFEQDQINAANEFGWRAKARHGASNLPRVIWVPGDDDGGSLGELGAAKFPGQNPRPIASLGELVTVYLQAADPRTPEDELAQYHVARQLYEVWLQAVYRTAHTWFRIRSQRWVTDKLERRYGATLRVVCEVQAPIVEALPDEPLVGSTFAGQSDGVDAVAAAAANDETFTATLTTEIDHEDED